MYVKPKKHLGQHFLKDPHIAAKIAASLSCSGAYSTVVEIGPGTGALTRHLVHIPAFKTVVVEVDEDSIRHLITEKITEPSRIIKGDFLQLDLPSLFPHPFAVIGNFPYNISSQILFKVLENRNLIPEVVGMFQKEVAERITAPPGNKTYGILSVLMQAYYKVDYLFTVHENVFHPPPKVKSAVIRCVRNEREMLGCDERLFFKVVKTAFNQRRKTLRNALRPLLGAVPADQLPFMTLRAERLSYHDFEELTNAVQNALRS